VAAQVVGSLSTALAQAFIADDCTPILSCMCVCESEERAECVGKKNSRVILQDVYMHARAAHVCARAHTHTQTHTH
jgi:hypothetical protein